MKRKLFLVILGCSCTLGTIFLLLRPASSFDIIRGERLETEVGSYVSYQSSLPATLQRLVEEIQRYPNVNVFVVRRTIGTSWIWQDKFNVFSLIYRRREKTLEDVCGSGDTAAQWAAVTDKSLLFISSDTILMNKLAKQRVVGASSVLLRDLEKQGCKNTQM